MSGMSFENLINTSIDLYVRGEFLKAYTLLTEEGPKAEGNEAQLYNFRYCFACKAGMHEKAMNIMREAVLDKGYWYSYDYLLGEDDIKPLRECSEFQELSAICREREAEAVRTSKACVKVIDPENINKNEKHPLLIALHGNGQNFKRSENDWHSCLKHGYSLALLQSSQIGFTNAYYWNDVIKGSNDLKEQWEKVVNGYTIDLDNIIIGGFSSGTRLSLYAILNDMIRVKGFILVGPWLPEIDEWEGLMDRLKLKNLKGFIICGDRDDDCIDGAEKFVRMLNQRDIPNIYRVVKDLSHSFPDDFEAYLKEALDFINS